MQLKGSGEKWKHEKRIKRFGHTTSYGLDFQSQAK